MINPKSYESFGQNNFGVRKISEISNKIEIKSENNSPKKNSLEKDDSDSLKEINNNNQIINIKHKTPSKSNSNFKKSSTTLQIIDQNTNTKTNNNNICNLFNKTCKNSEFTSIS